MNLKASIALALALTPMIASASPAPATPHFRTQTVRMAPTARDRAPKARVRIIQVKQR